MQELVSWRLLARMQSEGEAVGVPQDECAVGIAASQVWIEREVALVEPSGAIQVGDGYPHMTEAHS